MRGWEMSDIDKVLAIDPGNKESAYVLWDGKDIHNFTKMPNEDFYGFIAGHPSLDFETTHAVIEEVACYGMPVGKEVFKTVWWAGRLYEQLDRHGFNCDMMERKEVKMHLCQSMRAKDSNIITAIVDRFDPDRVYGKYGKGTKSNRGMFYGFSKDVWQAFAIALTWWDQRTIAKRNE
jgi:hypothetical protein